MAYATWDDLKRGVIDKWPDKTTADRFKRGLNRVAPPGMEACPDTAELFCERTDADAAERMVERWGASRLFRRR